MTSGSNVCTRTDFRPLSASDARVDNSSRDSACISASLPYLPLVFKTQCAHYVYWLPTLGISCSACLSCLNHDVLEFTLETLFSLLEVNNTVLYARMMKAIKLYVVCLIRWKKTIHEVSFDAVKYSISSWNTFIFLSCFSITIAVQQIVMRLIINYDGSSRNNLPGLCVLAYPFFFRADGRRWSILSAASVGTAFSPSSQLYGTEFCDSKPFSRTDLCTVQTWTG
jgi:hypothetical protein